MRMMKYENAIKKKSMTTERRIISIVKCYIETVIKQATNPIHVTSHNKKLNQNRNLQYIY